jgi:putative acetyltransferase
MNACIFRPTRPSDVPVLGEIFIDAVTTIGPLAYSVAQIKAWATWPTADPKAFEARVTAGVSWVAEFEGEIAAFAVFVAPDHLDFLYTRGTYARRGLATQLHQNLEQIARAYGAVQLRTEASYLSRPAFTKFGYHVTEIEHVERYGVAFTRFKMLKRLSVGSPATGSASTVRRGYVSDLEKTPKAAAEETVQFLDHDINNPGWFRGLDPRQIEGYFPLAWFSLDADSKLATAQRDYDASELSVATGDSLSPLITVGKWVQVSLPDLTTGWIPTLCLEG